MQHVVSIGEPAVEIAVARRDAGVVFRLEGTAVDDLLPHAVVGGEIDVLEELAVDQRVDAAVDGGGTDMEADAFLREGRGARQNEGESQEESGKNTHIGNN